MGNFKQFPCGGGNDITIINAAWQPLSLPVPLPACHLINRWSGAGLFSVTVVLGQLVTFAFCMHNLAQTLRCQACGI